MTIEERYAHWRELIETQKTSGLSISEYCRNQHIRSNVFYAWRRRISKVTVLPTHLFLFHQPGYEFRQ